LLEHGPVARHSQSGVDLVSWQLRLAEHLCLASYSGCLIGWIGLQTGSVIYWEIYSQPVAALLAEETGFATGCLTECWRNS